MTTVGQENARMLASLLGIEEADAADRLDKTVLVTAAPGCCIFRGRFRATRTVSR